MLKGFKKVISKYAYMILPIGTLLCLAGFIGSYLFPNEVLDTYEVNMKEAEGDQEFMIPFTGGISDEIGYAMETDGRELKGIQIGISKGGASLSGANLVYRVYKLPEDANLQELTPEQLNENLNDASIILENYYDLGNCMDGQYLYLPFDKNRSTDETKRCSGKLYITFSYDSNGNTERVTPALFANHGIVKNAATYQAGEIVVDEIAGKQLPQMIKHYYIYSHNTYPLLYDSRVLTFVFLAASMTVAYPHGKGKGKKKEGRTDAEEDN